MKKMILPILTVIWVIGLPTLAVNLRSWWPMLPFCILFFGLIIYSELDGGNEMDLHNPL